MESIGTLAGGVAHDFNNILCAILGYITIMKRRIEHDHDFFNYLETIEKSANRAAELTNQLLAFARVSKGQRQPLNINTTVRDTVELLQRTIDKAIVIEMDLQDDVPLVEGDSTQIYQMVMNLCVNARDAMPKGGTLTLTTRYKYVPPSKSLRRLQVEPGHYVNIRIQDTGTGMDEQQLQRIFDPFFTTKEMGKGTGLGLSVVYGVVKGHGGYIDVKSTPGRGTCFEIFFPASSAVQVPDRVEATAAPRGRNELVLIVDDEDSIRNCLKEILESHGYRALQATDGEQALELYAERSDEIDIVILDMIMPNRNGHDTFLELRKLKPDVKALLSTGYTHDARVSEIMNLGIEDYIMKPYNNVELLTKIRASLDSNGAGK
jgi:CheY-like chemotaxis protein